MGNRKIILARIAGVGLAVMFAVFVCGCGGGGGGGDTPPTVSNQSVTPASLTPIGGTVTIQATATDDVGVQSVEAVVTGYDPATQATKSTTVALTKGTGNTWSAQHTVAAIVSVPPGVADANGETTYTVAITATDTSGNKSTAVNASFKITGLPPSNPNP